jgi:hypothetical protein
VVTAGLTGNAVSGTVPGGGAAGAAVQFEMLATAGFDADTAVGGLTAFSLLGVGALLGLPILALPAMLAGALASPGLVHTAFVGVAGFCLVAIFGAIILRTDRPPAAVGRAAEGLRNQIGLATRAARWPGPPSLDQFLDGCASRATPPGARPARDGWVRAHQKRDRRHSHDQGERDARDHDVTTGDVPAGRRQPGAEQVDQGHRRQQPGQADRLTGRRRGDTFRFERARGVGSGKLRAGARRPRRTWSPAPVAMCRRRRFRTRPPRCQRPTTGRR